ncbi:hypothetical protein V865_004411 [Kwoniella europaea PYCC6329]|uniref:Uncharacterized protein n=1 Tax=Kwoniella europaea PYCC6329 TaxID=1423913 RepID=A0AAX4KIL8_9TREE
MSKSKSKAQPEAPQESTPSTLAEAQNQPGSLPTDPKQVQLSSSSSSSSTPKSRSSKKKSKNIPIITPPIFSEEQIIQYHLMHPSVSTNTISPFSIDPITLSSKKRKREGESPRFSHPLPVIWFEEPFHSSSSSGKKKDKKDKKIKRIHLSTGYMQVPDHAVKIESIGNSAAFWLGDLNGSSSVSTLSTNLADSINNNKKVEEGKEKEIGIGNASDKVKTNTRTKTKPTEKKTVTQAEEGKGKGTGKAEVKENSNKRSGKTDSKSNGNAKSKSKEQDIPQPKPKPTVPPTTTVTPKAYEPVNLSDTSDSESESSTSSTTSSTSSSSDETETDSDSDDESDSEPTTDPSKTSNYNPSSFDRPPPQATTNIDTPKVKTNGNAPQSTKKRVSLLDPSAPVQTLPPKQLEQLVTPTPTTVATPTPSGEKKKNKKRESTGGKGKKGPKWVTETPKVK